MLSVPPSSSPTPRSYVNVDFKVASSANAGGVNAGYRAASDSARLEATAYLDAVGRKLGPLLSTQSYDNGTCAYAGGVVVGGGGRRRLSVVCAAAARVP